MNSYVIIQSSLNYMLLFQNNDGIQQEIVELSKLPAGVKVQRMLSAFKQYKRRVFKPDAGVSMWLC